MHICVNNNGNEPASLQSSKKNHYIPIGASSGSSAGNFRSQITLLNDNFEQHHEQQQQQQQQQKHETPHNQVLPTTHAPAPAPASAYLNPKNRSIVQHLAQYENHFLRQLRELEQSLAETNSSSSSRIKVLTKQLQQSTRSVDPSFDPSLKLNHDDLPPRNRAAIIIPSSSSQAFSSNSPFVEDCREADARYLRPRELREEIARADREVAESNNGGSGSSSSQTSSGGHFPYLFSSPNSKQSNPFSPAARSSSIPGGNPAFRTSFVSRDGQPSPPAFPFRASSPYSISFKIPIYENNEMQNPLLVSPSIKRISMKHAAICAY